MQKKFSSFSKKNFFLEHNWKTLKMTLHLFGRSSVKKNHIIKYHQRWSSVIILLTTLKTFQELLQVSLSPCTHEMIIILGKCQITDTSNSQLFHGKIPERVSKAWNKKNLLVLHLKRLHWFSYHSIIAYF